MRASNPDPDEECRNCTAARRPTPYDAMFTRALRTLRLADIGITIPLDSLDETDTEALLAIDAARNEYHQTKREKKLDGIRSRNQNPH